MMCDFVTCQDWLFTGKTERNEYTQAPWTADLSLTRSETVGRTALRGCCHHRELFSPKSGCILLATEAALPALAPFLERRDVRHGAARARTPSSFLVWDRQEACLAAHGRRWGQWGTGLHSKVLAMTLDVSGHFQLYILFGLENEAGT
mmetsp:Transcript_46244/g.108330  ORF Transcript_46244/g.108330 Transcript_46244/m.108330 type:complete len:148 (+) Transcript_46244:80-523(+)